MSPAPTSTGSGDDDVTVIVELPFTPPALAVIDAVPGATAVTRPADDTVATPLFDELHVKLAVELGGDAVAVS
jgi:hypothetical protein